MRLSGSAPARRYHSRRNGTAPPTDRVDWRVVLDGKTMWVGFRPFDVPLHRREYRRQTVTGSLHPPVAAAMARLAHIEDGHRVLDPFCGAGTLLLEAHAVAPGATYLGVDSKATIPVARANTPDHASVHWRTGNARGLRGRVRSHRDQPALGHPPRHRQPHAVPEPMATRPPSDGRVVTILNQEQSERMIGDAAWQIHDVHDIAVAGQHPRILVAKPINPA